MKEKEREKKFHLKREAGEIDSGNPLKAKLWHLTECTWGLHPPLGLRLSPMTGPLSILHTLPFILLALGITVQYLPQVGAPGGLDQTHHSHCSVPVLPGPGPGT